MSRPRSLVSLVSLVSLALVLTVADPARGTSAPPPDRDVYYDAARRSVGPSDLCGPWGVVSAVDARRGVPTFLWATPGSTPARQSLSPAAAARAHVQRLAFLYHLPAAALHTLRVHRVLDTGRGGIVVVFHQRVDGLEVVSNALKVLMRRDGTLVALVGSLHFDAVARGAFAWSFPVTPAEAVTFALADRYQVNLSPGRLQDTGARPARPGDLHLALLGPIDQTHVLMRPVRIRRVLSPGIQALEPAYELELLAWDKATGDVEAWRYRIDAQSGDVLQRLHRTFDASYRVWAAPGGLGDPYDGPLSDMSPHPTGTPDGTVPTWTAPILVTQNGFNENPQGDPDPWLSASATRTVGNNAEVFIDLVAPDGFDNGDRWGASSAPGEFDYVYDPNLSPTANDSQRHAGAVQLFYTVNWLHDYFYDSGFTEAGGNAQQDNYGRGGVQGDPLVAQVGGKADGSQNNSSMSALGDGESPFMLTMLWQGSPQLYANGDRLSANGASFGQTTYDLQAPLVLADDGTNPITDACEAITNNVTGRIVLIDRGTCTFASKAQRAQSAGAAAAIIANNQPGNYAQDMPNENPPLSITIPVVSISYEDGADLVTQLQAGTVDASLIRDADVRQGALDSSVVAHEWGHYLHLRHVECGNAQCGAMSEGFADFVSGFMIIQEGDDFQGTYATGIYAILNLPDAAYFGIRRVPYSTDMTKNALTFRHIADGEALPTTHPLAANGAPNSEPHNAGEIWGTVMHDVYISLLQDTTGATPRLTFDQARRRMADYVVAGMVLTPTDPTYTEQRDGLLAAAAAGDPVDFDRFAHAFARRGLGTCAVSPARGSTDFTGLTESFDLAPKMRIDAVTVGDERYSCDGDGVLDASEVGQVTITLQNTGAAPLSGTTATVSSPDGDVTFPDGPTATFGTLAPFALQTATVAVALSDAVDAAADVQVDVTVDNAQACQTEVTRVDVFRVHYDEQLEASPADDVESSHSPFTPGGTVGEVWSRVQDTSTAGNHYWHADDTASFSDTWLESPDLEVSSTDNFVIHFRHRYRFEQSQGTDWDGGVIELTTDDGATWQDLTDWADPGYGGTLTNQSGNPLADRDAFVGTSPSSPSWDHVSLDLGTDLAGETVRIRFRVGTDQAQGEYGWDLDDLSFEGITNTPFPLVSDNQRGCDQPYADAGPDQTVAPGALVQLDGSASHDPQGAPLTFAWTQVDGPAVTLEDADTVTPRFTAPEVDAITPLTFSLAVSDGALSDQDEVVITVDPAAPAVDGGVGDDEGDGLTPGKGCNCRSAGSGAPLPLMPLLSLLGLIGLGYRRRRRR